MNPITISLEEHISNENAALEAQGLDGHIETDLTYWAEMDITTTEQFIHMELSTEHYERYSEVFSIKPRWYQYDQMTIAELKHGIDEINKRAAQMAQDLVDSQESEKVRIQKINEKNAYVPNLAFAELKNMLA